ncbi:polysaccharide biosynthesis tyrosine autokinase [Mucilaginibacter achroorhodeus]|uniref:non-specific protein-tyrosine kinase n=1 Tax=Mucilaginibacter achroorhodeus TaxID=2599294 RepID=A0A563U6M4_9SPHI|nr:MULTISPECIES: tyrosine-protein kinase [Mucilaginibacter]QXV64851.1 polysaccharide biosynthesis tyrosine autokinase [Mucilaginibacter sp. 21P]TWR27000.1 polysaccharide biosynthesis tyrosine autokinase [Mucilaginibacter achroorhodeus]
MKMQDQQYLYKESASNNNSQNVKRIWSTYSYHWPLFLISVALCLTGAYFYIQNNVPQYLIMAKIAINDAGKDQTETKTALEKLDILQSPKLAESEVAIIKSRPLIRRVVNELQLEINYQVPYHLTYRDVYNTVPVTFKINSPLKLGDKTKVLDLTIINNKYFELKQDGGKTVRLPFNEPLVNKFGRWQLNSGADLNGYIGKTLRINVQDTEAAITRYQKALNVILDRNAPLVDIQMNDQVAARGTLILNHLIGAYKYSNIDFKNQETARTLKFIDDRLSLLTNELSGAEKTVEDYKSSIGLTDISSQSQLYLNNIQSNDVKLNEVNIQLNVIRETEAFVNSASHTSAPATIGIADPGLVSLVDQLAGLELKMTRMLATTPAENPIFDPVVSQIKSTREAIKNKISSIKSSLIATKRQLESNNSNFESSIKSIPGHERQYVSVKRQQGIKENLYVYLLQKREEIALSYASTLNDARTVEDAYYELPVSSAKFPVAIALLCGLIMPAAFISTRKAFKNRILTKHEIELKTSAPIICELLRSRDKSNLVVLNKGHYAIGEQLRLLRTNLLQATNPSAKARVTLFTSSKAGEGKSFVASNTGASLAVSGKRTILIELDLRRPKISKLFNISNTRPGMSEYLQGKASIEEIIQPSGIHPDLMLIKSGAIPDNPSELLESERMELIINTLKFDYDNILIDSPPMRLVTDTAILAPLCDVCLYIVRHNYTNKAELEYIEEVYQSNKLRNMQIVFNSVEMDERFGYSMDWDYYADKKSKEEPQSVFTDFAARF